jgi:orotate phosphoribosyltransferase/outer membrane protein assembly factor BamB
MSKNIIKSIIIKNALIMKSEESNFFFTKNDTNWIFDFRTAFLQGNLLQEFSSFFWDKYEKDFPFQIWWLELWAIPFISWIIIEWNKRWKNVNWFFVRKERKISWLGKSIEWSINNEKIIIVDDLFNSWNSIQKVFFEVNNLWKDIFKIFVFVNFWNTKGKEFLERNNLTLDYEFTLSDFWLDIFWNSLKIPKENYKAPMIFPKFQKLFWLINSNKFLEVPKSSPIKDWKLIFMAWEWAKIVSLCSDTGNINWEFSVNDVAWHKNILSSPIIFWKNIVFWSYDWNLYSLDTLTGKQQWVYSESDWIWSSPAASEKYSLIYIWLELWGLNNKWWLAWVDVKTWNRKWLIFFDDYVHCSPAYSEKLWVVICWSNDWKLICAKWENWQIMFKKQFDAPIKWGFNFSDDQKKVYFGCFDKYFYCIDLLSWKIDWKYLTWNINYAKSLFIDNNIFFGSLDKYFYHLDNKWNLIKKIRTFWKILSEPTFIKEGIIAFASNDSYIYFYDFINKKTIFVIEHWEKINTKMIYDDKLWHLYVENFMNELYKYYISWYLN